ncbi:tetratricopeptide repeat protein [Streptomyces nigrescens]|uniref:ATP/GTP-binding protein n=1 Tax=Streptomyces nigrescens TaxID=1920 RepID=A0A640TMA9_STRNI|nr:tetratricopeptide repeat protein [Streptomyces libani]WAT99332.1 tetratricopeptide repeat protein [Streptomyces libani subsp. libani]GFE25053.1 ATP/GTP-binding protein [Streptomyces libani subsp. libani]GGW04884.1 ATP/GTP-binding protein [Streptomyces libani subsp. libani]
MDGHAEDDGRVYQSSRDQHISEYHYHGSDEPGSAGPDSVRRPAVGRAPVVLRDRADVLERLRASVAEGDGGQAFVLHGMGGCGKTAVAHAFFQFATEVSGRVGLWVNASDRASLRSGMLAVAADRGATDGELLAARNGLRPGADLVWEHLDRSAEPWLLVLDNADDPEILRDGSWLRTSPGGIVVVTTRRAAARWWPGAELQHIGVLPREDAARVLCDLAPQSGTLKQASAIADRLGRLPLALTLAGGFLSHQVLDPWTMDAYRRHLEEGERVELIDQGADLLSDTDPRHLVGRTWQLTLDAFEARGLPEAVSLLRLLARFASEPLPLTLLNRPEISGVLPRARTETALRALLDQSLTELVNVGVRCIQSHGVLLDSVASATPSDSLSTLNSTACRLLDAAIPKLPDAGPEDPHLRLLSPHVIALLQRGANSATTADLVDIATRLATALHRTGDYLSAWEAAHNTVALSEQILGSEHRLVLAARSRAGRALFRLGKYSEAEPLLRQVRSTQERLFGAHDPDTLDSSHGLQLVLGNLGKQAEALSLLHATIAGRQSSLGPAHPLTLRSRASLLTILSAAELEREDNSALLSLPSECERHLGPDHTVTLGARHNHSWALYVLGHFNEADEEIRLVADTYERRFGSDYPIALSAQQLYARIQHKLGNFEAAVSLMNDVTERRTNSLGAGHPFTAASRKVLAELRENPRTAP